MGERSCRCPCIVAIREHIDAGAEIAPEILAAAGFCEDARLASVDLPRAQSDLAALRQLLRDLRPYLGELEASIDCAKDKLITASEARRRLPAGSSRARVTTANARASTAAEALDRLLDLQRRYEEAGGEVKACRHCRATRGLVYVGEHLADLWECADDRACSRRVAMIHDRAARERRFALVLGARLSRRG